jgi:mono/diheme cytochrome c family protein
LVGSCGTCHAVTIVVLAGISGLGGAFRTHEAEAIVSSAAAAMEVSAVRTVEF